MDRVNTLNKNNLLCTLKTRFTKTIRMLAFSNRTNPKNFSVELSRVYSKKVET